MKNKIVMAKAKKSNNDSRPSKSSVVEDGFSNLNATLSKILPGDIIEDCPYAKIDEWIPTGSYILNAALSGSIFGGMPNRRSLGLAGLESSGKSFLALGICRNAQALGYNIIYCDSEAAIDIDFVKKLGIDTKKFRIQPVSTIQETSHFFANLVKQIKELKEAGKQVPKIMVVLDSLGNLSSDKEKLDIIEGSDKRDMTKQQAIRGMFRVVGNDFGMLGIPLIVTAHIYSSMSMYTPNEISGGGGLKYNASIIMMLSKSKMEDKDSEEKAKKDGVETTRVGVTVTITPFKQRFARPIKTQVHIPFYKPLNPFVGLEKFVSWDVCGIVRGKALTEKEYSKLSTEEQKTCGSFTNKEGKTMYALPKETSRNIVCEHLGEEIPLNQLFTDKVFTQEVLEKIDNKKIKPIFMLPDINSLDDLSEIVDDIVDAEMNETLDETGNESN